MEQVRPRKQKQMMVCSEESGQVARIQLQISRAVHSYRLLLHMEATRGTRSSRASEVEGHQAVLPPLACCSRLTRVQPKWERNRVAEILLYRAAYPATILINTSNLVS